MRSHRRLSKKSRHGYTPPGLTLGFTLIEVLVAIVLIHVGLLSLVAASAMLVRRTTETRIEAAALEAATNRLESLTAGPCAASSGTAAGAFGLREEWSAQLVSPATLMVRDSVWYGASTRPRGVALRTAVPC